MSDFGGFEIEDDIQESPSENTLGGFEIEDDIQKSPSASAFGGFEIEDDEPSAPKNSWLSGDGGAATLPDGELNEWGGNLRNEGRKVLLRRDDSGKVNGYSTTSSMVVKDEDGSFAVIPTVVDGKDLSPDEAVAHYAETGEHWGRAQDEKSARDVAQSVHSKHMEMNQSAWNDYLHGNWDDVSDEIRNDKGMAYEHKKRTEPDKITLMERLANDDTEEERKKRDKPHQTKYVQTGNGHGIIGYSFRFEPNDRTDEQKKTDAMDDLAAIAKDAGLADWQVKRIRSESKTPEEMREALAYVAGNRPVRDGETPEQQAVGWRSVPKMIVNTAGNALAGFINLVGTVAGGVDEDARHAFMADDPMAKKEGESFDDWLGRVHIDEKVKRMAKRNPAVRENLERYYKWEAPIAGKEGMHQEHSVMVQNGREGTDIGNLAIRDAKRLRNWLNEKTPVGNSGNAVVDWLEGAASGIAQFAYLGPTMIAMSAADSYQQSRSMSLESGRTGGASEALATGNALFDGTMTAAFYYAPFRRWMNGKGIVPVQPVEKFTFSGLSKAMGRFNAKREFLNQGAAALEAGGIMGIQGAGDTAFRQLASGEDLDLGEITIEGAKSGLDGIAIGAIMGAGRILNARIRGERDYEQVVRAAAQSPEGRLMLARFNPDGMMDLKRFIQEGIDIAKAHEKPAADFEADTLGRTGKGRAPAPDWKPTEETLQKFQELCDKAGLPPDAKLASDVLFDPRVANYLGDTLNAKFRNAANAQPEHAAIPEKPIIDAETGKVVSPSQALAKRVNREFGVEPAHFDLPQTADGKQELVPMKWRDNKTGKENENALAYDPNTKVTVMQESDGSFSVHNNTGDSDSANTIFEAVEKAKELALMGQYTELDRRRKRTVIENERAAKYGKKNVAYFNTMTEAAEAIEKGIARSGGRFLGLKSADQLRDPSVQDRDAFYTPDGTTVVILDNVHEVGDISRILAHEIVGHGGPNGEFGGKRGAQVEFAENIRAKEFEAFKQEIVDGLRKEVRASDMDAVNRNLGEVFAHYAAANFDKEPSKLDKLVSAVNVAARKLNLRKTYSAADVRTMMARWRNSVKGEGGATFDLTDGSPRFEFFPVEESKQAEVKDETGDGADEAPAKPEQGEVVVPAAGEAARPVEGAEARPEASDAGVVEPRSVSTSENIPPRTSETPTETANSVSEVPKTEASATTASPESGAETQLPAENRAEATAEGAGAQGGAAAGETTPTTAEGVEAPSRTSGAENISPNLTEKPAETAKPVAEAPKTDASATAPAESGKAAVSKTETTTTEPKKEADFGGAVYVVDNGEIVEGKITGVATGGRTRVKFGDRERLLSGSKIFATREIAEKNLAEKRRVGEESAITRAQAAAEKHVVSYGNGQKGTLADMIKSGAATLYPAKGLTIFDKGAHVVTIGMEQFKPTVDELPHLAKLQQERDAHETREKQPVSASSATGATTPPKAVKPEEAKNSTSTAKPAAKRRQPSIKMKDEVAEKKAKAALDAINFDTPELGGVSFDDPNLVPDRKEDRSFDVLRPDGTIVVVKNARSRAQLQSYVNKFKGQDKRFPDGGTVYERGGAKNAIISAQTASLRERGYGSYIQASRGYPDATRAAGAYFDRAVKAGVTHARTAGEARTALQQADQQRLVAAGRGVGGLSGVIAGKSRTATSGGWRYYSDGTVVIPIFDGTPKKARKAFLGILRNNSAFGSQYKVVGYAEDAKGDLYAVANGPKVESILDPLFENRAQFLTEHGFIEDKDSRFGPGIWVKPGTPRLVVDESEMRLAKTTDGKTVALYTEMSGPLEPGVNFDTKELDTQDFDPARFGKLVTGVGKLVDVLMDSGYKDFKSLATYIYEQDPEKYGRAKPVLQDVWNIVARSRGLTRVRRIDGRIIDTTGEETDANPLGRALVPEDGSMQQSIDRQIAASQKTLGMPPPPAPGSYGNEKLKPDYEPEAFGSGIEGNTVAREEVIDKFRELFPDVAIRGRGTRPLGKSEAGHFEPGAGIIRSKNPVSLRTIPHEIGHYIDAAYRSMGLKRPTSVQVELFQLGKKLYGSKVPTGGYESEGFAELMKYYMQGNTEGLKKEAPAAYSWLLNDFAPRKPDVMARVDAIRDLIDQFQNQSGIQAVRAMTMPDPSLGRRLVNTVVDVVNALKPTQENWIDKGAFISKAMKASGLNKLFDWREAMKKKDYAEMNRIIENHPVLKWKLYNGKAGMRAYQALAKGLTDLSGTRRYTYGDLGVTTPGHNADELLPTFKEIFADFTPKELDDFKKEYAVARVAKELYLDRGLPFGLTEKEVEQVLKKYANNTKFKEALDRYTHYKHGVLHLLVDAGAMSQEQFEAIVAANPIYVKISRHMDSLDAFKKAMMSRGSKAVNKRRGGSQRIEDIFDAGIVDDERVFRAAFQADLFRSIVNAGKLAEQSGGTEADFSVGANWIHEVPNAQGAVTFSSEKLRKQIVDALKKAGAEGANGETGDTLFDALFGNGDNLTIFKEKPSNGKKGIVSIYGEDGRLHTYELPENNTENWAKGLLDFTDGNTFASLWEKWGEVAVSAVRAGATQLNPVFAIRNLLRDTFHAATFNEYGTFVPVVSSLEGVYKDLTGAKPAQMFDGMGLQMGGFMGRQRLQGARKSNQYLMSRNWFEAQLRKGLFKAIADVVGVTENGTRIKNFENAYDYMLKHGASDKAAQMVAGCWSLDATIDFLRSGYAGQKLNKLIPFFNAGIQGLDQFVRGMGWQDPKAWDVSPDRKSRRAKTVMQGMAWLTTMSILGWLVSNALRGDDDPEDAELPPHERWNYISFGSFRMPVPYEAGYIFASIPKAILETVVSGDKNALPECLKMFATTFPLQGGSLHELMRNNALFGPLVDVAFNEDWKGSQIIPSYVRDSKESWEWYTRKTTGLSKDLGRALHKVIGNSYFSAPAYLDVMFDGWTGGLYSKLARLAYGESELGFDVTRPSDWPILGTLFRSPTASRTVGNFYDEVRDLERKVGSATATVEEVGRKVFLDKTAKEIRPLWDENGKLMKSSEWLTRKNRFDKMDENNLKARRAIKAVPTDAATLRREGIRKLAMSASNTASSEQLVENSLKMLKAGGVTLQEAKDAIIRYAGETGKIKGATIGRHIFVLEKLWNGEELPEGLKRKR